MISSSMQSCNHDRSSDASKLRSKQRNQIEGARNIFHSFLATASIHNGKKKKKKKKRPKNRGDRDGNDQAPI